MKRMKKRRMEEIKLKEKKARRKEASKRQKWCLWKRWVTFPLASSLSPPLSLLPQLNSISSILSPLNLFRFQFSPLFCRPLSFKTPTSFKECEPFQEKGIELSLTLATTVYHTVCTGLYKEWIDDALSCVKTADMQSGLALGVFLLPSCGVHSAYYKSLSCTGSSPCPSLHSLIPFPVFRSVTCRKTYKVFR